MENAFIHPFGGNATGMELASVSRDVMMGGIKNGATASHFTPLFPVNGQHPKYPNILDSLL